MKTKQFVIGVDLGTGGCRVACMNDTGEIVSDAYRSYRSYYPQPRWVEQKPREWVEAAIYATKQVIESLSLEERNEIKGISFSASHHNAVLLDSNQKVLRDVIMWNDQRTDKEVDELTENYGKLIYDKTKNNLSPTWTLPQLRWIQKNEPKIYEEISTILFVKDYVRYCFSGVIATDYIEAEGTLLYDIQKQRWSEEICQIINLPTSALPKVYSPTDVVGTLKKEIATELGLSLVKDIPIVVGTADTAAEIYGSGAINENDGVVKLATAGNVSLITKHLPQNNNIVTYEHVLKGMYYLNSPTNFAASSYRWFKENFYSELERDVAPNSVYPYINKEIEKIGVGSEGLIFHPYLNGERAPHWNPYLRGSFFGLTAKHNRAHFARSVLEGVAYSLKDAMLEFTFEKERAFKVIGGGANGKVWIQILSDILNLNLECPRYSDASFGTCLIAATAVGWFKNLEEAVKECQSIIFSVTPVNKNVEMYKKYFEVYKELYKNTKDISKKLNDIT